ncbi:MAG: hypothetical protein A2430_01785 [Candidatus Liptonbacteria bacterium RIFOXYC1_FULL_36_8]|uniref:50S ribosomal protein L28 n=3 Tax=Candidatus Liptoniibacteriota TaxID=1817909 RepID=A0A1G2CPJ9_9BACT|nr:MAG: hypothetical protein A2390_03050 [Candidatus Liptonbacteria bacterium RIFOXYB1_FULL_36_10]OGZ04395.1 MAG: hypothetical protein A2430_01785 [Candidatus Liptonbacteria bacterium RIFOXYC1_FULL_36_8]OGZ04580.1 MAG: hypothetical protein A2604_01560 [Candidatus Liptonbacteria bacterium RIFOXYD1_FULL_36_11]
MRQCSICGKGSMIAGKRKKLRGNYNPVSQCRKYPNLQKTKIGGKRVIACVKCMKTATKNK